MKKYLLLILTSVILLGSCQKDDLSWMQEIESIKAELANQKKLIEALQANAHITGIETNGDSYTIKFSNGQSITLTNGKTPLVTIGDNGNWYINGEDTGSPSRGSDGEDGSDGITPTIEIVNGYWWINGKDTGIKAEGKDGKDGLSITKIIQESFHVIFIFSDGSEIKMSLSKIRFFMPDNIYMMNNTNLQVFKSSIGLFYDPRSFMLDIKNPNNYNFGYNRDTYYEYQVNENDPDFSLTFGVYNDILGYNYADHETRFIHVKPGKSPAESKNVLIIGDSFSNAGYWTSELKRLLTGITNSKTDNRETAPIADHIENLNFIGSRTTQFCPAECYGGKGYEFFSTNDQLYDNSIPNPFWNTDENRVDFDYYSQKMGINKIDFVIIQLGTNGFNRESQVKYFWDALLEHNPKIKVIVIGRCYGAPFGPGTIGMYYNHTWLSLSSALDVNFRFEEYTKEDKYKDNFLFVHYHPLFDSINNMQHKESDANNRNPNDKIVIASDNAHPSAYGYYQIADAVRPAFHYWFLNSNE